MNCGAVKEEKLASESELQFKLQSDGKLSEFYF